MDTYTKEFLRFGVVRCAHCGKELNYKPDLPSNFVSLHMGEDGRLRMNLEENEPYCCDCIIELRGGNNGEEERDKGE